MVEVAHLDKFRWKTEYGSASSVDNAKHVRKIATAIVDGETVFLDTETDGLDANRHMRLLQIGVAGKVWLVDPRLHGLTLVPVILKSARRIVAHNAVFDLINLLNHSEKGDLPNKLVALALSGRVVDTMVCHQVLYCLPQPWPLSKCAKAAEVPNIYEQRFHDAAEELGLVGRSSKYSDMPLNHRAYLEYAAHDVFQLQAVYELVLKSTNKKLWKLVELETQIHILYGILQQRGMFLDMEGADQLQQDLNKQLGAMLVKLEERGISTPSSPGQVRAAIRAAGGEKLPRGIAAALESSTSKSVLNKIKKPKKAAELAQDVLKARSLVRDRGAVRNLMGNSMNSVVHPYLRSIGTVTGRSSCSTPNLQQLNKHQGDNRVRALLQADPGHRVGAVDYNGLEVRVGADLAKDHKLIADLMEGVDVHGRLAGGVYGKDYVASQRDKAKRAVFAILYGASPSTVASTLECTLAEATAIRDEWNAMYPTLARAMKRWPQEARRSGKIVLPNGWQPLLAKGSMDEYSYVAVNYHMQGMAAFVVKRGAVQLAEAGLWEHVRMVVHDEFMLSLSGTEKQCRKIMKKVVAAATVKTKRMQYTCSSTLTGGSWDV